jgi:PAS domain S-box-containing protein
MSSRSRVLHLEDDRMDAELVQDTLEAAGIQCEVTRVETQSDFVFALRQQKFDLILADYTLPSFDGLSALSIARQQQPDLPFIYVSGTLGEEVAIEALKIGATDYVLKTRLSRLAPSVQRALREAEEKGERKRAEETARRSEKELRDLIENVPAMMFIALPGPSNVFASRGWREYTGLSSEHTSGSGWQAVIHPDDFQRHIEKWRLCSETGQPFEDEARFRGAANGEYRWFLVRAVSLRGEAGNVLKWFGVLTDIEDRKRAEQLQAEIAHVHRVTMLGELAASISHELHQPLAATVTNAAASLKWLERGDPGLQQVREGIGRIIEASERASEIIDHLRVLYRKDPPQRTLVDVNQIIPDIVLLLRGEAERFGLSIHADLAADIPKITADRVQLQQVLMNLMLNGIEATKDTGGVLTLKSKREKGEVLVSVSDTGVGLPADEQADQIFNTFFTTKPGGSGMGLAISRSIIESHGGRIWATRNNGRGASFHFSLPTATHAADPDSS